MGNSGEFHRLQDIAEAFSAEKVKVVSFDLFDTLVFRPLERSDDVFELLDRDFSQYSDSSLSFRKLRVEADAVLRRRIIKKERQSEDFTLDEVYDVLQTEFFLDAELAEYMKKKELELELRLCTCRKSGKWLWEQALAAGKRIIVLSDMILTAPVLKQILEKNGYHSVEKVYVSSETGTRKVSGALYDQVAAELELRPEELFHIGDNQESDCRMAAERGWGCAWLPNTIDVFNKYGCSHQAELVCRDLTDWEAAKRSVGIGACRKMAANLYFDDPFRPFDETSAYNGDLYFAGYAALGPELLGLVRWIADQVKRDRVETMIFMARDGYLPMKAYEVYRILHPELPAPSYLPVSRMAVLPGMIRTRQDLYDLPVDVTYQTPAKLLKLLHFCDGKEGTENGCPEIGSDETLTRDSFQRWIRWFIENRYDEERHEEAVQRIRRYLLTNSSAPVKENAAVFDMGYSGRIPEVVRRVSGCPLYVYYFHADVADHYRYERRSGMKIRTFFDFNPQMESTLREYSYLEPAPSCIGYTEEGTALYDCGPAEGYREHAGQMQAAAMDFLQDYLRYFGAYEEEAQLRGHDAAMPFEALIRHCSVSDRILYEGVLFDDELWGGRRDIDLRYLIETRLRKLPDYAKDGRE